VLENASRQKGHFGKSTSSKVVNSPSRFLSPETIFFFLQGLQSSAILDTVNIA
jgi:hypothetical protein